MKRLYTIIFSLVLVTCLLFAMYVYNFVNRPLAISRDGELIELSKGESTTKLAAKLEKKGYIENRFLFKLYARIVGADKSLKAGEYFIKRGVTVPSLFKQLKQGKTYQRSITFVEGWTYKELFQALKHESALNWDVDETVLNEELDLPNHSLEGMFFADTYFFSKHQSVNALLKESHQDLENTLAQEWQDRDENLPFKNAYEALILASIVEKETALADERPLIAGVFINRLNKKMRLQTDPTVIYGLGDSYKGNLTKQHLQEYTPYNTYRIPALPPTPIAIVGKESIHAVLHPHKSDYLYFVAKGDGSHYFSSNFEEHQQAVKKYQWKRVENYRSTPVQEK